MKPFIIFLAVLFPSLSSAITLNIPQELIKDVTNANCQAQLVSCNAVLQTLLEYTKCEIKQDKLVCPDEIKKDEPKKPD